MHQWACPSALNSRSTLSLAASIECSTRITIKPKFRPPYPPCPYSSFTFHDAACKDVQSHRDRYEALQPALIVSGGHVGRPAGGIAAAAIVADYNALYLQTSQWHHQGPSQYTSRDARQYRPKSTSASFRPVLTLPRCAQSVCRAFWSQGSPELGVYSKHRSRDVLGNCNGLRLAKGTVCPCARVPSCEGDFGVCIVLPPESGRR
jgi:hypothetical protein